MPVALLVGGGGMLWRVDYHYDIRALPLLGEPYGVLPSIPAIYVPRHEGQSIDVMV